MEKLEALGFVVNVESVNDDVIAENCIISQSVEADSELGEGGEITLTVSLGRQDNDTLMIG